MFRGTKYANVMSTLALLVAIGGTSYAAVELPKNSVGSPQLKSNAVKSVDIKDGEVTTKDVKEGSLLKGDFAPGQLPSGVIPTTAAGVALAAVGSPGITVTPTNSVWFNRLGGAPTIVKTSDPSAAEYKVTFPGLTADGLANTIAMSSGTGSAMSVTYLDGGIIVKRMSGSAGPFQLVVYAANPSGSTTP